VRLRQLRRGRRDDLAAVAATDRAGPGQPELADRLRQQLGHEPVGVHQRLERHRPHPPGLRDPRAGVRVAQVRGERLAGLAGQERVGHLEALASRVRRSRDRARATTGPQTTHDVSSR
jgi:hypothetical protein